MLLTLSLLLRQLWWALFGPLNVDEFEHLQILWLFEHGILPYRDYLYSHLPVYNLLLFPLYAITGPVAELPGLVRTALFPLVLLTVWQVGWIGSRILGRAVGGWASVILFLSSPVISESLAEMRPDTFALPLALGGAMLFLSAVTENQDRPFRFYASGLLLGSSLLFSQKSIFLTLLLAFCYERYHHRVLGLPWGARLRRLLLFTALLTLPFVSATAGLFASQILDLEGLIVMATNGMHFTNTELRAEARFSLVRATILSNAIVFFAGLIGAMRTRFWSGEGFDGKRGGLVFAGALAVVTSVQVLVMPLIFFHVFVLPSIFLSILAVLPLIRRSTPVILICLALVMVSTQILDPNRHLRYSQTRVKQEARFRFVLENVPEDAPVLDSYNGFFTFRPIVGKIFFYRPGMFSGNYFDRQSSAVAGLLAAKKYGAVIEHTIMDSAPRRVRELIGKNYRPSKPFPDILLPKPDEP